MTRIDHVAKEYRIADMIAENMATAARYVPLVMGQDVFVKDYIVPLRDQARPESREGEVSRDSHCVVYRHQDFCSLYVVCQGSGTHVIADVPYGIARGDVYTMGMGMEHYFIGCENLKLNTIHFSTDIFSADTWKLLAEVPGFDSSGVVDALYPGTRPYPCGRWLHLRPDGYAHIDQMIGELQSEWLSGTRSGALLTPCLFLRLLIHLARLRAAGTGVSIWRPPDTSARSEAMIAAAVYYIDTHFAEPIHIHDIARRVFLSPDRFTEVFCQIMGRTPSDYLRHVRLEYAKTLLRESDLSITEVAQEAGFTEVTYFIRAFRKSTRMTPGAYRRTSTGSAPA